MHHYLHYQICHKCLKWYLKIELLSLLQSMASNHYLPSRVSLKLFEKESLNRLQEVPVGLIQFLSTSLVATSNKLEIKMLEHK